MALKHFKEFSCDVATCTNSVKFHPGAIVELPKNWLRVATHRNHVNNHFMVCGDHADKAGEIIRKVLSEGS